MGKQLGSSDIYSPYKTKPLKNRAKHKGFQLHYELSRHLLDYLKSWGGNWTSNMKLITFFQFVNQKKINIKNNHWPEFHSVPMTIPEYLSKPSSSAVNGRRILQAHLRGIYSVSQKLSGKVVLLPFEIFLSTSVFGRVAELSLTSVPNTHLKRLDPEQGWAT